MREIKFRAWDKIKKLMLNVDEITFPQGGIHWSDGSTTEGWVMVNDGFKHKLKETVILMQYTGLKDKNGKEICEGDIALMKNVVIDFGYPEVDFVYEIKYVGSGFYLCNAGGGMESVDSKPKSYEIIGNIYENPELLK